jgi:hypothetical protein
MAIFPPTLETGLRGAVCAAALAVVLDTIVTGGSFYYLQKLLSVTTMEALAAENRNPTPPRLTNAELCSEARAFAQKIRDFRDDREWELMKTDDEFRHFIGRAQTEQERTRIARERHEFFIRWVNRRDQDFAENFVPRAKYFLRELVSRLPPQPKKEIEIDKWLFGSTAGANAFRFTADRLDVWAKKVCPKP